MGKRKPKAEAATTEKAPRKKKTAPRPKQKRIEGTFEPLPDKVRVLAEELADARYERLRLQQEEQTTEKKLLAAMHDEKLETIELDDYVLEIDVPGKEKIKIKKKKEAEE